MNHFDLQQPGVNRMKHFQVKAARVRVLKNKMECVNHKKFFSCPANVLVVDLWQTSNLERL